MTDASNGDINGNTDVDVTPGTATQLAFSSQPSDTFTQHQIGAFSVKITDAYGNQTADDDSIQLSVNGGAFDAGTDTQAASGGTATFNDLEIDTPGTYTLDASDTTNETVASATSDSFDILAHADIALTMSASPDGSVGTPAIAGTNETYTLTVTNNGPDMNTSYSVTASVPSGTQKVSAPGCTGTSTLTCSGGALANGASKDFVITLHIGSDYAGADSVESLSFSATVALTNPTQEPDNSVENDTATQTFDVIGQADLSNTLTAPAAQQIAGAGAGFDYTLKVKHHRPLGQLRLPVGVHPAVARFLRFVQLGRADSTCGAVGQVVTCSNSGLVDGQTDTYTVHALISLVEARREQLDQRNGELDATTGSERRQQHVGERGAPHDHRARTSRSRRPRPRSSGRTTTCVCQHQRRAEPGDVHGHGVQDADTSSTGPSDAQAVKVTDTPPTGTSFVAAESSTQCSLGSGVVRVHPGGGVGRPARAAAYTIVVKVSAALRGGEANNFTNTANVTSTTVDINGVPYPKSATSDTIRVHTGADAPTDQQAEPGNTNAFYLWQQDLSANGGEPIDFFAVTATGPGGSGGAERAYQRPMRERPPRSPSSART